MKNIKIKKLLSVAILCFAVCIISCSKYEEPGVIDSNKQYSESPVITEIIPSDSAMAGVRELTILGSNFATGSTDTTWIVIGGTFISPSLIKSISSDKIVVYRPRLEDSKYDEPTNISVSNPAGLSVSNINNYKIENPGGYIGDFSTFSYTLFAVDLDKQENLYIGTQRAIYRSSPNGVEIRLLANLSTDFRVITDLKFGPGGFLYVLVGKTDIFRFDLTTNTAAKYLTLPSIVNEADFDAAGNIFAAKSDGIFVVKTDNTILPAQRYIGRSIGELRVNNNFVYVSVDSSILSRNSISNDGSFTLSEDEQLFNINDHQELAGSKLSSFTIAEDGTIYLCLKNHAQYSLFVLEANGSATPFYVDNILPAGNDQLIWGNSRYLYLNRGAARNPGSTAISADRIFRMPLNKTGAVYNGRSFL